MMTRRQFLPAGAVSTGTMWAAGAGRRVMSSAGPVVRLPLLRAPRKGRTQGRPFVMDVHVHMDDQVSGITQTDFEKFRTMLYRPWTHVYNGEGTRIPRPDINTPSVEDLIKFMDQEGVDVSVIMPSDHRRVASPDDKVSQARATPNEFIAEIARKYPTRLIGIAGHDPLRDEWKAAPELERCVKELGMRGMKLYPPYDNFDAYAERLFPVYAKALELEFPLTFHTGWTPLLSAPLKYARPEPLDRVGIRFPGLKVNLAHVGGPAYWKEALLVVGRHPSFTCDISSWCTYPPQMLVEMLNLARDLLGLDRVLFGSEHNLCPPGEFIKEVRNINRFAEIYRFPPFELQDIDNMVGRNAARLYKWEIK
jgi:predicted TIM-barrel fold metal-dependent hydrolase